MKGYKVSDAKYNRIIGVACNTLEELKIKGKLKLGINEDIRVQMRDGTFVDDDEYFKTLPPQTLFLLLRPHEETVTGAILLYNALKAINIDYFRAGNAAEKFFTNNVKDKMNMLSKLLKEQSQEQKIQASKRVDDPQWFDGIDSRAKTKEEFMARRCQERMRGYYYKTQEELKKFPSYKTDSMMRTKLTDALHEIIQQLKHDSFFSGYFDRSAKSTRLCDKFGIFYCRGQWNSLECRYTSAAFNNHTINPYESREARIVFSTWNFDHIIERSRTVIPALLEAAKLASENECAVNYIYFYKLLFTTANLKLVHVVCHDKGAHNLQCDLQNYIKVAVRPKMK